MKKLHSLLLATFAIAIVASIIFMPSTAKSSGPVKKATATAAMPDSIQKVFEKSCMSCHANDGNGMAKGRVNFSKWDSYSPEKQADKAKAICKVLTKGSMPPKGFCKSHPDDVPTKENVTAICKWAGSFNK